MESCDTHIDKNISEGYGKKISTHERVQSFKNLIIKTALSLKA